MNVWTVVIYRDGIPLEVSGPYNTRKDAREVIHILKEDDKEEWDIGQSRNRYKAVKMYRFMTRREIDAMFARMREE